MTDVPELSSGEPHTVEAIVDRLIIRDGISSRLGESVRLTASFGESAGIPLGTGMP